MTSPDIIVIPANPDAEAKRLERGNANRIESWTTMMRESLKYFYHLNESEVDEVLRYADCLRYKKEAGSK